MNDSEPGPATAAGTGGPDRRRRMILPAAVGATALLLGGAAFAVAAGASEQDSAASPSATEGQDDTGDGDGTIRDRLRDRLGALRGMGGHHGPGLMGGGIHGEFVVPDDDGSGYRTVLTQGGEVTAVSATSITVTSEDDYTHTYVVTEDTSVNAGRDGIENVEVGHDVRLLAVSEGGKDNAVHVGDLTTMQAAGERWGFGPGHGPMGGPMGARPDESESGASTSGLST